MLEANGHSLEINVHDIGEHGSLRQEAPLEVGHPFIKEGLPTQAISVGDQTVVSIDD